MRRSRLAQRPRGNVKTNSFSLKGGLNLVDAPLKIPPGMATNAVNYELRTRDGYRRIAGYERFDGQPPPSESTYWLLNYDNRVGTISKGDVITGLTSSATAVALNNFLDVTPPVPVPGAKNIVSFLNWHGGRSLPLPDGPYDIGDLQTRLDLYDGVLFGGVSGYVVIINILGTFQDNELLQVSAATKATANGLPLSRGALTPEDDAQFLIDAEEAQRDLILVAGSADGSGPLRGCHVYKTDQYAFRDNTAVTQCLMWKASPTGWIQQSLGNRIHFTDGGTGVAYVEGEVITGTVSTASATITRVVLQSGAWGTDAKGYFIIGAVTGGPFQAEATTGSTAGAVPIDAAEIANIMLPGGRYEFENYNFFGSSLTQRMYGVNGASEAFEWDGSVFVPIITGNTIDKPSHLVVNEYHLQLSFPNGSLQNSSTGTPYQWTGGGAAEIGTGDEIVGMKKEVGGALIIVCRNRTFALHGKNTTSLPWDLKILSEEAGGLEWSLQRLGSTKYMDDRGFMDIKAVLDFGDFNTSTYSQLIEPLVNKKTKIVSGSIIVKQKSQIRMFFTDGTGIIATFNGNKLSGFTSINYINKAGTAIVVRCTANGEDATGKEILFFGSDDGYLYQMDKGTSFDGGAVTATLNITYNHLGSPSTNKQVKKVVIEADGAEGTLIKYNALYDYSSGRAPTGVTFEQQLSSGGSLWNTVNWNEFSWASSDVARIEGNLSGVGRNIALQIWSSSVYGQPYTLHGITYSYIIRNLVR